MLSRFAQVVEKQHRRDVSLRAHCLLESMERFSQRSGAVTLHGSHEGGHIPWRCCYNLCAVVIHLGATPQSGHDVAVARHPTSHGEWWLYDDDRRIIADDEYVTTSCANYRGVYGQMQSYIVIYGRAA